MQRRTVMSAALLLAGLASIGLAGPVAAQGGWLKIFNGKDIDNWNKTGNGNWTVKDGAVEANTGGGFLVSKEHYGNFEMRTELWISDGGNTGVFIRCGEG